jgi:hypothetical protein
MIANVVTKSVSFSAVSCARMWSELWHHVVLFTDFGFLKEQVAPIFRVEVCRIMN